MQAWLIELSTGVALCLGGVGLWTIPPGTPVVGRPPVAVGWLVIGLGVLVIALSIVTRSGFEFQFPVRRKSQSLVTSTPEAARTDSATRPALSAGQAEADRINSDLTGAELVALGNTPGLTNAERSRLLAPHTNKWLRIEGTVNDVDGDSNWAQVSIATDGIEPPLPATLAYFRGNDRVAALRKGSRIRVLGKFVQLSALNGLRLQDCELLP